MKRRMEGKDIRPAAFRLRHDKLLKHGILVEKHRKNSPLLRGQMTVPHEGAHWRSWGGHVASVMLASWHNVLAKKCEKYLNI